MLSSLKGNKTYLQLLSLNVLNAILGIFIYKFTEWEFGADKTLVFTVFKRIITFIAPVSLLGLGIALPRAVNVDSKNELEYLVLSSLLVFSIPMLILLSFLVFPETFNELVWGNQQAVLRPYNMALFLWCLGTVLITVVMSYYRGKSKFTYSIGFSTISLFIVPYIIMLLLDGFDLFIHLSGIFMIAIAIAALARILYGKNLQLSKVNFRDFLGEGSMRMFGDLSFYFLMIAPSYLALQYSNDLVLAAAVSFCQVLLSSGKILVQPISFVALTKSVKLSVKDGGVIQMKKMYYKTTLATILVLLIGYILSFPFIDDVISLTYTKDILIYSKEVYLYFAAVPLFAAFVGGRSFIDGFTKKPIIPWISLAGCLVFIAVYYLTLSNLNTFSAGAIGLIVALLLMNILSFLYVRSIK